MGTNLWAMEKSSTIRSRVEGSVNRTGERSRNVARCFLYAAWIWYCWDARDLRTWDQPHEYLYGPSSNRGIGALHGYTRSRNPSPRCRNRIWFSSFFTRICDGSSQDISKTRYSCLCVWKLTSNPWIIFCGTLSAYVHWNHDYSISQSGSL